MLCRNICWYETSKEYFRACRVESWSGWMFIFGLGSLLFDLPPFQRVIMFFLAFSLATSSIYVLNQYFDREADRENEVKFDLPVASGRITAGRALIFSILLVMICFILVLMADTRLSPLFLAYLGLWTIYSAPPLRLKTVPIVDFAVSGLGAGFLPFLILPDSLPTEAHFFRQEHRRPNLHRKRLQRIQTTPCLCGHPIPRQQQQ